jgi:holliday junction DNA helicase RuvA
VAFDKLSLSGCVSRSEHRPPLGLSLFKPARLPVRLSPAPTVAFSFAHAKPAGMIAKLTGRLDDSGADWAVIDVAGVGYLVHCSARTLTALGIRGDEVAVFTDLQVSENDMRLIGFASGAERDWFRLLTAVQGVGSKVALAILSALTVEELQRACAGGDAAQVARAQGVGPKLASRIVNELRDKAGALSIGGAAAVLVSSPGSASADAVSALENLGFKPAVAAAAVAHAQADIGEEADLDALVRAALRQASR